WGFAYCDRIYAAPYISLCDIDWAIRELEWALDEGARIVVMRPAAVVTEHGPRSPADPMFDPFWSRAAEAGITVIAHAGDSGYGAHGYVDDDSFHSFTGPPNPLRTLIHGDRPIHDFLAALMVGRLFDRHPRLRVASIENGSAFLPALLKKLTKIHSQQRG